jgi:hypothetical protein
MESGPEGKLYQIEFLGNKSTLTDKRLPALHCLLRSQKALYQARC